jgi:hypothetical protein
MQCFIVWIAMQFVHACCLRLYLQFQCMGRRSHRGGSASRTKGSVAMSPGRRHSKRLNSTRPGEFALGVHTRRAIAGKRVEVSAVGEHNSPSPWTPVPRDQFKLYELTGDICQDGTLPSPMRDCPWPDDDSHAEEDPSELPSPMRDCPRPDDDSHAKEEPSEQTPISTQPQNNESCLRWYYLIDVYQSIRTSYLISMLLFKQTECMKTL